MARVWSILVVLFACFAIVSTVNAQDKGKGKRDPGARFDALEKAAKHDPLKGELSKQEFIDAVKAGGGKMADRAEEIYNGIKKADENKVTKDEYVQSWKDRAAKRKKKDADK